MERILTNLIEADREIKKRHRYFCGIEDNANITTKNGVTRLFFLSPDGQNGELYYLLKEKGLLNAGYTAPYHWKVREKNTNWFLGYTEGDIAIYQKEI